MFADLRSGHSSCPAWDVDPRVKQRCHKYPRVADGSPPQTQPKKKSAFRCPPSIGKSCFRALCQSKVANPTTLGVSSCKDSATNQAEIFKEHSPIVLHWCPPGLGISARILLDSSLACLHFHEKWKFWTAGWPYTSFPLCIWNWKRDLKMVCEGLEC